MNEAPLISFVTVNYNGLKDTCELIDSLQQTIRSVTYEIIVIDNDSRRDEAELIRRKYPSVISSAAQFNSGFAGGSNLGYMLAKGKYIFFINNDAYLTEDGLPYLIERLESHPTIAAVSPKIRFAFPPQNIQFAGYTPLSLITMRNESVGFGRPDDGGFNVPHPTPYLHGAALMVKREVIEKVGMMPEIYFLYYEELDWCTRMTRAGYELWYEPRCTVFHKESQSTGQLSRLRAYYLTRNRLLYAWRNFTGSRRYFSILYQMALAAGKNSILFLLKGHFSSAIGVWQGVGAFILLPHKTSP